MINTINHFYFIYDRYPMYNYYKVLIFMMILCIKVHIFYLCLEEKGYYECSWEN